jgi:tetraacyldisaccharide 4'-kinase
MTGFDKLAEKVRRDEPIPFPLSIVLRAGTAFVRAGMWARLHGPRVRVGAQVISFGNITAGGTGKTPAVIERARFELGQGKKVAVLTRGYRSPKTRRPVIVEKKASWSETAEAYGDEPALILAKVPGVVAVKCVDRVAAAETAIEECGCDTLILDDGFQYVRLERDENIAVIDATNPFGNGRLTPRGILREPLNALGRATHVILTHCDQVSDTAPLVRLIDGLCPGVPVRKTWHKPTKLVRVSDGQERSLDVFAGEQVTALCAVGNPEAFVQTLESSGLRVTACRAFADHYRPRSADIPSSGVVVTTEKNALFLDDAPPHVFALEIELSDFGGKI